MSTHPHDDERLRRALAAFAAAEEARRAAAAGPARHARFLREPSAVVAELSAPGTHASGDRP